MLAKIEREELVKITLGDKEITLTKHQYEELKELVKNDDGSEYYLYNSY